MNPFDSLDELIIENSLIRTRKEMITAFSRFDIDTNQISYLNSLAGTPQIIGDSLYFRQIPECKNDAFFQGFPGHWRSQSD
jgi:hypothetical protein